MTDTLADWLNEKYPPATYPDDASAIASVLATLVAGGVPPRVEVEHLPDGRFLLQSRPDLAAPAAFRVWYCCYRYGRTVPVHDVSGDHEASANQFSCIANPPWAPNDTSDRYRPIYDAALAALLAGKLAANDCHSTW